MESFHRVRNFDDRCNSTGNRVPSSLAASSSSQRPTNFPITFVRYRGEFVEIGRRSFAHEPNHCAVTVRSLLRPRNRFKIEATTVQGKYPRELYTSRFSEERRYVVDFQTTRTTRRGNCCLATD